MEATISYSHVEIKGSWAFTVNCSGIIDCRRSVGFESGSRTFAPRSPADLSLGDDVEFNRDGVEGAQLSRGRVKYMGHLPGRSGAYVGVQLERECK